MDTKFENQSQFLPNDTLMEIMKHMKTYNQLQICNTNKAIKVLCNQTINHDSLIYNLKYKTIDIFEGNYVIINNGNIYINGYKKMIKLKLPDNVIPLSCHINKYYIITLTTDGLYYMKYTSLKYREKEKYEDNTLFQPLIQPLGKVLYMDLKYDIFVIITSTGLYYI